MRSTIVEGMTLMSGFGSAGSPGARRRPLISTRVRAGPGPGRTTGAGRGAEAAQIDGGGARGAVGEVAALAGEGLRQRVDQILGPGRALEADFLAVDDGDRAGRGEVGLRNAGTGDDDRLIVLRGRAFDGAGLGLLVVLRGCGRGKADGNTEAGRGQQVAQKLVLVPHVGPLRSAAAVIRAPASS